MDGKKAFSGAVWSFADRLSSQLLGFIVTVVMARLLLPSDYGLIGLLIIFVEIGDSLSSAGVTPSLVAKGLDCPEERASGFCLNLAISAILYVLLWFAAPLIAEFYSEPELVALTRIVALSIPLRACGCVSEAIIMRNLDYRRRAIVSFGSIAAAGILGISMAATGSGVLAIAWFQVAQSAMTLLLLFVVTFNKVEGRVLGRGVELWRIRRFWRYGRGLIGAKLADVAYQNSYIILLGRLLPVAEVGYFTRGRQFASVPSISINEVIRKVSYPVLCRYSSASQRQSYCMRMSRMAMMLTFPLMLTLSMLSDRVVATVLGQKWIQVAPLMTWLCVGMMWTPLDGISLSCIMASGNTSRYMRVELIRKILGLAVLAVSFKFGIEGICIGFAISGTLAMFVTLYASFRSLSEGAEPAGWKNVVITLRKGLLPLLPMFVAAIIGSVAARSAAVYVNGPATGLCCGLVISIAVTYGLLKIMKIKELPELINRLKTLGK